MNLHCKNEECGTEICYLCISERHIRHNIVDLETEEKGKIDTLVKDLKRFKEELLTAKRDSADMTENVIQHLEKEKEKFVRRFNNMIAKVRNNMGCNGEEISNCIKIITHYANQVQGIGVQSNVKSRMELLEKTRVSLKNICKKELTCNYFKHQSTVLNEAEIDRICGELVRKEVVVNLSGETKCTNFIICGKNVFRISVIVLNNLETFLLL